MQGLRLQTVKHNQPDMYNYAEEKSKLTTDEGFALFLKIRDYSKVLLNSAGCFTIEKVISCASGDPFLLLACVDRLVELGEIKEVPQHSVATQYKIFKKS